MKGFIEVTSKTDDCKRLVAVAKIQYVGDFSGMTAIVFQTVYFNRKKTKMDYIYAAETYDEVCAKIKEATE